MDYKLLDIVKFHTGEECVVVFVEENAKDKKLPYLIAVLDPSKRESGSWNFLFKFKGQKQISAEHYMCYIHPYKLRMARWVGPNEIKKCEVEEIPLDKLLKQLSFEVGL